MDRRTILRYGGKTIVIAAFVPISSAPSHPSGRGRQMSILYMFYNVLGSLLWVLLLVPAGYFFANVPLSRIISPR